MDGKRLVHEKMSKILGSARKILKKISFPVAMCINFYKEKRFQLDISDTETSLKTILEKNLSVSRFGDGEFNLINGEDLKFQKYSQELSLRLSEILSVKSPVKNHAVCIPFSYASCSDLNRKSRTFWTWYFIKKRGDIFRLCNRSYSYLDSQITRIYINRRRHERSEKFFSLWKQIWNGKDILVVEGEKSRFGVGNDLFDNVKNLRRILCPAENAFSFYDRILEQILEHAGDSLVLLVLGPTATVLSYDLAAKGIRALDIGNMDMEYEWFCRGVKDRVKIDWKYSFEISGGTSVRECNDEKYLQQIICRVN